MTVINGLLRLRIDGGHLDVVWDEGAAGETGDHRAAEEDDRHAPPANELLKYSHHEHLKCDGNEEHDEAAIKTTTSSSTVESAFGDLTFGKSAFGESSFGESSFGKSSFGKSQSVNRNSASCHYRGFDTQRISIR